MNSLTKSSTTLCRVINLRSLDCVTRNVVSAAIETNEKLKSVNEIPGPRSLPFVGSALSMITDKREYLHNSY